MEEGEIWKSGNNFKKCLESIRISVGYGEKELKKKKIGKRKII